MTDEEKGTGGTQPYNQDASQADRRRMLKQDQAARTYFDIADGDPDDDGPRSATVTGSALPQLAVPRWLADLGSLPKERPLGIDINAVNDTEAVWFDPDYVAPGEEPADGEAEA